MEHLYLGDSTVWNTNKVELKHILNNKFLCKWFEHLGQQAYLGHSTCKIYGSHGSKYYDCDIGGCAHSLQDGHQCSEGKCCLHLESKRDET
jgi:hypothetical protein